MRRLAICLIALFPAMAGDGSAAGEPLFPIPALRVPSPGPEFTGLTTILSGDVDGDGIVDLVSLRGYRQGAVSVFLGQGHGAFVLRGTLDAGYAPTDGVLVDLDLDGRLDLVLGGLGSVVALPGDGRGGFGPEVRLDDRDRGRALAVGTGDFNRDGWPDLAATLTGYNGVAVHLGAGDGSLQPAVIYETGGWYPADLAIADFDRDGVDDIAVSNNALPSGKLPSIAVLPGEGDGTFGPPTLTQEIPYPSGLAAGELTGDGQPDLVYLSHDLWTLDRDRLGFLAGLGDGRFEQQPPLPLDPVRAQAQLGQNAIRIVDLGGDGRADILSVSIPYPFLFRDEGSGEFTRLPIALAAATSVQAADLNDDGHLDPIIGTRENVVLTVLSEQGKLPIAPPLPTEDLTTPPLLTDLDQDAFPDLFVATGPFSLGSNRLLLGLGDGRGGWNVLELATPGRRPRGSAAGDFDRDGIPDLAVSYEEVSALGYEPGIVIWSGAGDGALGEPRLLAKELPPGSLATGDFDGDGAIDLAAAESKGRRVAIHSGDGHGAFLDPIWLDGFESVVRVVSTDLDDDARDDLLIVDIDADRVVVRFGAAVGEVERKLILPTEDSPTTARPGDLTGDGQVDIAVAHERAEALLVYPGAGAATFREPVRLPFPSWVGDLALADYDGDGLLDLAAPVFGIPDMGLHLVFSCGEGRFERGSPFYGTARSIDLVAGDLDLDGLPDLVVHSARPDGGHAVLTLRHRGRPALRVQAVMVAGHALQAGRRDAPGVLPVAVISSSTFDAQDLVPDSLRLAGSSVRSPGPLQPQCRPQDSNHDGRPDLVCLFGEPGAPDPCGRLVLRGETRGGRPVVAYLARVNPE